MILRPFRFHRSVPTASRISSTSISSRVASPTTTTRSTTTTTTTTRVARLSGPFTPRQHRPLLFSFAAVALGFSIPLLASISPATRLDGGVFRTSSSSSSSSSTTRDDAETPPPTTTTKPSKTVTPAVVRQISLGSILGLGAGVLVAAFSRTLTLLFGVAIVIVQYSARSGYNIIPIGWMQRYVKGINLRTAMNDNVAFKISFGLTFALAAFGRF